MTEVTLQGLNKIFQGRDTVHAVQDLDLTITSGQITALLGPSGCGKTTTLKMIAGLLHPTSGDIRFDERSVMRIPPEKRGAAMVFQNYLLFPYMSVGENVGFGLRMRHVDKLITDKKVADILELVKLPGMQDRRPKQLSGGQQQRVALARALVIEPEVLLLDEPLSNLDAHLRDEMRELILSIQRQLAITTVFVTHDQEEAVVLADTIALMFEGKLTQFDQPNAFYERPVNVRTARFFGGVNFVAGEKRGAVVETALGLFDVNPDHFADGPAVITIRPENLRLGESGKNSIQARIRGHVYVGTHARFKVEAGDQLLEVVTDAASVQQFHDGETVQLGFPRHHIWLVEPEEA
ncbi:MAG: ABC transporter ATP-binding protein [Chloroflexi bacterium]|nr:ABC transporter ATP-binding protein [Chloroflexota bacterium]